MRIKKEIFIYEFYIPEGDRQKSKKKSNSLNYIVNVLHIFVHQNSMNEAKMNENLVTIWFEYYII